MLNCVSDKLEFKVKSLVDVKNTIQKVYWTNWEDFVTEFDIEFLKKTGFWSVKNWIGTSMYSIDRQTSKNIFEAYQLDRDSSELFAEIKYDAKDGKLIFTQNTHNGTKTTEFDEFELNKKIHVRVTTSKIEFDGRKKNIINPGRYYTMENELKSRKTRVKIIHQNDEIFKVTDFSIRPV